jgi:hypothetical protein
VLVVHTDGNHRTHHLWKGSKGHGQPTA